MMDDRPLVVVQNLSFRYQKTVSGRNVTALREINLRIGQGEFVVITGPSGSGKSTLGRCLNGLIPHATRGTMEGDVVVGGMNTREHAVHEYASSVGMVFQNPEYQLVTDDVEGEIAFGLEIQNLPEEEIHGRLEQAAGLLDIRHLMGRPLGDLSWGERQRVAIASVIVMQPSVLVLDEAFSGIDESAAENLTRLLLRIRADLGTTIVLIEHRIARFLPVADRLIVLRSGEVVYDGRPLPAPDGPANSPGGPAPGMAGSRFQDYVPEGADIPAVDTRERPRSRPILSFRDVSFRYPGSRDLALDRITLDLYPGELAVLTGPNGSGKTTLLKHCNGLLIPDSGSVMLEDVPLSTTTVAGAARTVGLLGQHADYLIFEDSIAEELAFAPKNQGVDDREVARRVEETLARCSLSQIGPATPPLGLSGGEKQRVAIASVLTMNTPVIVLDEPTFGLDPGLKRALGQTLRDLCHQGRSVLVATHDQDFGRACGDRFIGISAGRIVHDLRDPDRLQQNILTFPAGRNSRPGGMSRGPSAN